MPGFAAAPSPPPTGKASAYARSRAGAPWIDVMRPSGRDFPLQPHFGVNRIANWSPSVTTTITIEGLPITSVGTVSHPTLAATNLAASMRRWRLTSAAVVDSVADQRSAGWACWRGNAAGLGGWTFVTRISLTTLQATGIGFFGLYLSIRYTERLAEAGIDTSVGSVGDSYDNALAESIIGLFKTEVIKFLGPWKTVGQVEWETLKWVDWYNKTRLHSAIGYITPQEAEEAFYASLNADEKAA